MFHREKTFWLSTIAFPWRIRATCDCDSRPPLRCVRLFQTWTQDFQGTEFTGTRWLHSWCVPPRVSASLLCGWVTKSRRTDRVSSEHGPPPEHQDVMLKYSFQFKLRHRLFYKTNTIQKSLPCVLNSQSSDGAGSHSFYRFFQKLSNLVWHSWHHFQSHKLKPRTRWFIKHPQQIWLHDEQLRHFSSRSPHQHCSCRWGGLWWLSPGSWGF